MRPSDVRYFRKVQRRVGALQPEVAREIIRALATIRDVLSEQQMARLISSGQFEVLYQEIVSAAETAFGGVGHALRRGVADNVRAFARDLPTIQQPAQLDMAFDILNPKIIDAIRGLESAVLDKMTNEVRETTRAFVENGLREGIAPREVARGLRGVIGIAPNQATYVANLRAELEAGNYAAARARALIDSRFNLDKLADLPAAKRAERIDTIVEAYRKSWVAQNTEVNARSASLAALKSANRITRQDAIDRGVLGKGRQMKRWHHLAGQVDPRPEHEEMDGVAVPFDQPYPNGDQYPGEQDPWNCHCTETYFTESI